MTYFKVKFLAKDSVDFFFKNYVELIEIFSSLRNLQLHLGFFFQESKFNMLKTRKFNLKTFVFPGFFKFNNSF